MTELLEASLAFPTVSLTILLGVIFLYWVFVILGALDIDLFSSDAGHGGHHGGGDGHGGDGHGSDGHAHKSGTAESTGGASSFLHPFGLRRVPFTISITLVILFAWTISLLCMYYLGPWIPHGMPLWLFGLIVLVASVLISMPLTALAITPLAPAFVVHSAMRARDLVGSTCSVTTGRVGHDFGQAKVTDNGAELVIPVRCDQENKISRHDKALVIDYDAARHAYLIEPLDEVFTKERKEE